MYCTIFRAGNEPDDDRVTSLLKGSAVAFVGRSTEVCNGFDDDCDGQVDEG